MSADDVINNTSTITANGSQFNKAGTTRVRRHTQRWPEVTHMPTPIRSTRLRLASIIFSSFCITGISTSTVIN